MLHNNQEDALLLAKEQLLISKLQAVSEIFKRKSISPDIPEFKKKFLLKLSDTLSFLTSYHTNIKNYQVIDRDDEIVENATFGNKAERYYSKNDEQLRNVFENFQGNDVQEYIQTIANLMQFFDFDEPSISCPTALIVHFIESESERWLFGRYSSGRRNDMDVQESIQNALLFKDFNISYMEGDYWKVLENSLEEFKIKTDARNKVDDNLVAQYKTEIDESLKALHGTLNIPLSGKYMGGSLQDLKSAFTKYDKSNYNWQEINNSLEALESKITKYKQFNKPISDLDQLKQFQIEFFDSQKTWNYCHVICSQLEETAKYSNDQHARKYMQKLTTDLENHLQDLKNSTKYNHHQELQKHIDFGVQKCEPKLQKFMQLNTLHQITDLVTHNTITYNDTDMIAFYVSKHLRSEGKLAGVATLKLDDVIDSITDPQSKAVISEIFKKVKERAGNEKATGFDKFIIQISDFLSSIAHALKYYICKTREEKQGIDSAGKWCKSIANSLHANNHERTH